MRTNECIIIIGKPRVGKTSLLRKLVAVSPFSRNLIYNAGLAEAWNEFPRIRPEQIPLFNGTRQILEPEIPHKVIIKKISELTKNCFVVFDDATMYIDYFRDESILRLITIRRHINVDTAFVFHSLKSVPVDIYKYTSKIVLFKTEDSEKEMEKLVKIPNLELFREAYEYVKNSSNEFAHCVISI